MTSKSVARPSLVRNASWAVVYEKGQGQVYRQNVDVRIKDGAIAEIAAGGSLKPKSGEGVLEGKGMLLIPGLIDIHSHPSSEPSYRGVREDHGVPSQYMTGLHERSQAFRLDTAGKQAAQVLAYAEMLQSGVTTVCDLSTAFDGWVDTMKTSGLRVYAAAGYASARWSMAAPHQVTWKWDEKKGRTGFEAAKKLLGEIEKDPRGRLKGIVYPLQIDTCTEDLLRESMAYAEETGRLVASHIAQSVVEVQEMIRRHGCTPIQWAASIGILKPRATWGHCIFLDEHPQIHWHTKRDLAIMAEHGISVAHCPQPFARYGAALDYFNRYRAAGVNMALGTDVAPHNLIEEMRTAIIVGRVVSRDIRAIDAAAAFHAATLGGARALMREDVGRIAVGARADLALVDLTHPLMQPARDPLRSLIYHAADRAVRTVLVDGEVVCQDGKPVGLDVAAAAATLTESQAKMLKESPGVDYAGRTAEEIAPLSLAMV